MYRSITATVLAALIVSGCSGGDESGEAGAAGEGAAPAPRAAMPDSMDHGNMPGMDHDTASASPGGTGAMNHGTVQGGAGAMVGMDHSKMGGGDRSAPMAGMDHSQMASTRGSRQAGSMAGMDHSRMNMGQAQGAREGAMRGMDHARMSASAGSGRQGSMQGMDHSRMNMGGGASGAAAGIDHAQMGHTTAAPRGGAQPMMDRSRMSARGNGATVGGMDHSQMSMGSRGTPRPSAGTAGTEHGAMTMPQSRSGSVPVMQHGAMSMPRRPGMTGMGEAPALLPANEGTEKLLTLVGALVRDPVVQQEIQQDPALREAWADPDVREIVLRQP